MSYFEIPPNGKVVQFRIRQMDEDIADWYYGLQEGEASEEIREAIRQYIKSKTVKVIETEEEAVKQLTREDPRFLGEEHLLTASPVIQGI